MFAQIEAFRFRPHLQNIKPCSITHLLHALNRTYIHENAIQKAYMHYFSCAVSTWGWWGWLSNGLEFTGDSAFAWMQQWTL